MTSPREKRQRLFKQLLSMQSGCVSGLQLRALSDAGPVVARNGSGRRCDLSETHGFRVLLLVQSGAFEHQIAGAPALGAPGGVSLTASGHEK